MNDNKNNNRQENIIIGRNCVSEALKSGRELDSILITRGAKSGVTSLIIAKARDRGITVKEVDSKKLDYMCGHANHQGIIATAAVKNYSDIEDIFNTAQSRGEDPFILILDEIEDPHNLGAIIRTAECAGVHGIIIPKRRSAGLTYTVNKSSAGALEHMHIVKVTNLSATIETLKERVVWIYGTDMSGEDVYSCDMKGSTALVIGNEGKGISRLIKEKCDRLISLPMYGKINSLNASVAAGIAMYEAARQRRV